MCRTCFCDNQYNNVHAGFEIPKPRYCTTGFLPQADQKVPLNRCHTYACAIHCFGRLDYCDSLLYKVPTIHISKLQRFKNSAVRFVCSTYKRFNHITPTILFSLHWLTVTCRIEFKRLKQYIN